MNKLARKSTLPEASVRSTNIARDPWLSWYLVVDYARNSPGARPLQSLTVKNFADRTKPWKFNNTQNFHANYIVCSKLDLVYCEICKRDFFLFILLFFPLFSSNLSQLVCISRGIQCIARSLGVQALVVVKFQISIHQKEALSELSVERPPLVVVDAKVTRVFNFSHTNDRPGCWTCMKSHFQTSQLTRKASTTSNSANIVLGLWIQRRWRYESCRQASA